MTLHDKEHLLHKILAGSAFAFALALLPIANYYLVPPTSQSGSVLGASTDQAIIQADAPAATPCYASKSQQDIDLDSWLTGQKQADLLDFNKKAEALADNQSAVTVAYQAYLKKLNAEESAVESQKNAVASSSCPAE
jgi:hypothetical protein